MATAAAALESCIAGLHGLMGPAHLAEGLVAPPLVLQVSEHRGCRRAGLTTGAERPCPSDPSLCCCSFSYTRAMHACQRPSGCPAARARPAAAAARAGMLPSCSLASPSAWLTAAAARAWTASAYTRMHTHTWAHTYTSCALIASARLAASAGRASSCPRVRASVCPHRRCRSWRAWRIVRWCPCSARSTPNMVTEVSA